MQFYLKILVFFILLFGSVSADDKNSENKLSLYTGTFDFSDEGARSTLYGVQYINLNSHYDSFLGKLYPVTGFFITVDNSKYIYTDRIIAYELSLAIKKFKLSRKLFDQLIDARSRDFLDLPFADEAELYQYLYGTSSTICMLFLEVMCPKNCPLSHDKIRAAQSIGVAWALTGIMRSSNVLAEQRRIYIPKSVMKKYCFDEEDFFAQRATSEIKCLTEHIVSIARNEIRKSRNLLEAKWDDEYLALSLQAGLSEMYLNKVESLSFDPFSKKIETGQFWRQLKVAVMAARAWF